MRRKVIYPPLIWLGRQKTHKVILVIGSAFMVLILACLFVILLAADVSAFGRFPTGTRIGGVYVGNMTREEALETCRRKLSRIAKEPVCLKVDTEVYSNTPEELGISFNYEKIVDEAYKSSWRTNILERLSRRFLNKPRSQNLPPVPDYDEQKVNAFVAAAMGSINCKPRNAYIDVTNGIVDIVPPRDGREAKLEQVLASTREALDEGRRTVNVPVAKRTPPKIKEVFAGKLILVNLAEHTLSLFDGEVQLAKYPVAVGSPKWPTCIGEWKAVKAEKNPTWYNRGSAWAENMPYMIGPGPNNPLGTRAITINGGGVLIHGTRDTGSIGRSASHGCIRMYMSDVEALFEHVYIGMPVYIIKRTGEPGFDCSKKPFWK